MGNIEVQKKRNTKILNGKVRNKVRKDEKADVEETLSYN
jgi:hypothetical protein